MAEPEIPMRTQTRRRIVPPLKTVLSVYQQDDGSLRFYVGTDGNSPHQLMGRDLPDPGTNKKKRENNAEIFLGQLRVLFGTRGRRHLVISDESRALLEKYIGKKLLAERLVDYEGTKAILPTAEERPKENNAPKPLLGISPLPPFIFAASGAAEA